MKKDDSPEGEGGRTFEMKSSSGGSDTPFIVIFTDLDGSLLDHETYGWEAAGPALERCRRIGVPVVMVSSKTGAEMDRLRRLLGLEAPFISENGGGVFFPLEAAVEPPPGAVLSGGLWKWSMGVPYGTLLEAFREIRGELAWSMKGFSEMTPEEISLLTGLDLETATLAAMRDYDEPFILFDRTEGEDLPALVGAAEKRGLRVSRGGRFYHLHGRNDKGAAVGRLLSWYGKTHLRVLSVALGDSPNDFAMLKRVTYPVLIRSTRDFPGISEEIPGLSVTGEKGPRGWNAAVMDILDKEMKGGFS